MSDELIGFLRKRASQPQPAYYGDDPTVLGLMDDAADCIETLERDLAAARAECEEQARLVGMGSEREARLMAERDEALREHGDLAMLADTYRTERDIARDERARLWDEAEALADALRGLLADTQHATHNCGDPECPVDRARAALGQREG